MRECAWRVGGRVSKQVGEGGSVFLGIIHELQIGNFQSSKQNACPPLICNNDDI